MAPFFPLPVSVRTRALARSLARTQARTPVLSPSSFPPLPRNAVVAAVAVVLVLGDAGRNGLFFRSFGVLSGVFGVLCFGWLVGWFVVGIHLVFEGTARLPCFCGRGEEEGWIFVLFLGLCSVLLVPCEDDEYGGRQGGSGPGTIVFSSG